MAATMENIKKLREMTGAGLMDVKKALEASNNDIDAAIEWLKENGIAKAAKKAGRVAAEGVVVSASNGEKAVLIEINTETDFVATNETFLKSVEAVKEAFLATTANIEDFDTAMGIKVEGQTVDSLMTQLTATIGEKISYRRAVAVSGKAGAYTHTNSKVAVLVQGNADEEALRGIAMHVAAMQPKFKDLESIDEEHKNAVIAEIKEEKADTIAGKPEKIQEQILKGAIAKRLAEDTLSEQDFVMDSSKKVKDVAGGTIETMLVFNLGEGIEKVESDFAAEVAAAVQG